MNTEHWKSPITIENPETGSRRTVRSVRQAKVALDHFWPSYHGSQFERAEHICDEALKGHAETTKARQAFIAAAAEAHLHFL